MRSPSQDRGAPPADAPQAADNLPAVEPGQNPRASTQPAAPSSEGPTPTPAPPKEPAIRWKDVIAKPMYQGLTPEQKEQVREAYWKEIAAPRIPADQQKIARQAFDKDTVPKDGPQASGGTVGKVLDYALGNLAGGSEAALHVGSSLVALPAEAAASMYQVATAPPGLKAKQASDASAAVGEKMTYQPKTPQGKLIANLVDDIAGVVPKVADWATEDIAEDPTIKRVLGPTGSAALQGIANTTAQALPTLMGARAKATAESSPAALARASGKAQAAAAAKSAAEATAEAYVKSKTKLDWNTLDPELKAQLTTVAQHAPGELDKLKPGAIEREVRLKQLGLPASRGKIERDPVQMSHEEILSAGASGEPLVAMNEAADTRFHQIIDDVKKASGSKAVTEEDVGRSVQDTALRGVKGDKSGLDSSAKAVWSKANYDKKFDVARKTEPTATVQAKSLYDLLEKNPHIQRLGWVESWLKRAKIKSKAEPSPPGIVDVKGKPLSPPPDEFEYRGVTLDELDDLRKDATAIRAKGGPDAHYAGQVLETIDKAMQKIPAAAKNWRAAYDAFKAHKIEFEDQSLVRDLTEMDSRTDPVTAHEKTTDRILRASAEDIRNLKKTLTEGGTEKTRAAGTQAWKDIQSSVLEHLRDKASGKRKIEGSDEQVGFDSAFRDEFHKLDRNGKIVAIFDPATVRVLRTVNKAVGDLRTRPKRRSAGSDTVEKLRAEQGRAPSKTLKALERAGRFPYGGKYIAGAAKQLNKWGEAGAEAQDVEAAQTSRLSQAAKDASELSRRAQKAAARRRNTLRSLQVSGSTYRGNPKDKKKDNN